MSAKGIYSSIPTNIMAKSQYSSQVTGNIILNYRYYNEQFVNRSRYASSISVSANTSPSNDIKPSFSPQAIHQTGDLFIYLNSLSLTLGSNFTVSYWIYFKNPVTECGTTLRLHSGSNYIYLSPLAHNNYDAPNDKYSYICEYYNGSNINRVDTAHGDAPDFNQWCHVAFTSSNGKNRFFINGVLKGEENRSVTGTLDSLQFGIFQLYGGSIDVYLDDIVLINNQCLWETNFAVPTGYLINESPESQYTSNITGNIVFDIRSINDNKVVDESDIIKHSSKYIPKDISFATNDGPFSDNRSFRSYQSQLTLAEEPNFFTTFDNNSKFTISMWIKITQLGNYSPSESINSAIYLNMTIGNLAFYVIPHSNDPNVASVIGSSILAYNLPSWSAASPHCTQFSYDYTNWAHIAVVRNNGYYNLFVNGTLIQSIGYTLSYNSRLSVGFYTWEEYTCLVNDFVFIKDQALWATNFEPPNYYLTGDHTLPTRIKNTRILYPKNIMGDYFDKAYLY